MTQKFDMLLVRVNFRTLSTFWSHKTRRLASNAYEIAITIYNQSLGLASTSLKIPCSFVKVDPT